MINSIGAYSYQTNMDFYKYTQNYDNKPDLPVGSNNSKISQAGKKECQTCKNRKYIDGSNESNVSFKTPAHISVANSASAVAAHEYQHVANAVKEGSKKGNRLLSVSVTLRTSVCPECGRTYTSGGTTKTTMLKSSENANVSKENVNPYEAGKMLVERFLQQGQNINMAA